MHKLLLAAALALPLAGLPAFAQDTDCPPGTTARDGSSPVTCDNDDNSDDTTGMTDDTSAGPAQQNGGGNPLTDSDAGQGVSDAVNNAGGNNNGGGGNND
jgi:hypothetical protein